MLNLNLILKKCLTCDTLIIEKHEDYCNGCDIRNMIKKMAQDELKYYDEHGYFNYWSRGLKIKRISEIVKGFERSGVIK